MITRIKECWDIQDAAKIDGKYPDNVFDFISIHEKNNKFSIILPSKLRFHNDRPGVRFNSENREFNSYTKAAGYCEKYKRRINNILPVKIVDCGRVV